ncbi:MAG: phosphate ABC transporter ATP-binding protein [Fimbriimonadaceae bacterium]|nr:phosphate ABC transporter ATP-binding protein [Fimbriimonadaceae bacterium]
METARLNGHKNTSEDVAIRTRGVEVFYGQKQALKDVTMDVHRKRVTSLIGPSGCGKSTFLRTLNRMNDRISGFSFKGSIEIEGENPYAKRVDLLALRRNVGMVFQKPNPFPMTIFENVALGPRMHYGVKGKQLDEVVESALVEAALWDEVKDDYKKKSGLSLSGGQQQRVCIARMLAVRPEIILMDEPCSALDPMSTAKIEELILKLKEEHTVVVVTHNLQQAERIGDYAAFFMFGEVVEHGSSKSLFHAPSQKETQDYVSGRFG